MGCICSGVLVEKADKYLTTKMEQLINTLSITYEMEEISQLPAIYYARKAYRCFGKDPARYRLSAESLLRRVTRGDDLYRINNVVDIINMVSLQTGFSIGGYDADKIEGDIVLDMGTADEMYEGVGRGWLNIGNLPVLKDESGPFGSPTTDSVRTSVSIDTKRFLMVFFDFGTPERLEYTMEMAAKLLQQFASAHEIKKSIVKR
jgi:DNA/RNA-binding domain of Phe-tRNA-synthetase-like protein